MRLILALVACLLAAPMPLSGRSTSTPNTSLSALGSTSSEPSSEDAVASSTTTSTLTSTTSTRTLSTSVDTTTTGATTSANSTPAASVSSSTPAATEASTAPSTPTTVKVTKGKEDTKASAYLVLLITFMVMTTLVMVVVVVVVVYKQGLCNCCCRMFPCCKEIKDYLDEEESAGLYDSLTWSPSKPGFRLVVREDPR
ncbi:hypothetical protein [Orf virus]|nr:hypothetical protein [Orf virus]